MPAAARGKFFFSMSLQISRIFVIMLFVALASLGYVSSRRVRASVRTRGRERRSATGRRKASANSADDEGLPQVNTLLMCDGWRPARSIQQLHKRQNNCEN